MPPPITSFLVRGDDGVEYGPVDLAELREWVLENRAGLGTEVKRDEPNSPWQQWQDFPELVALLAEVSVTSAPPEQLGVALAPFGRRILAFALDLVLSYIFFIPLMIMLAFAFLPDWLVQSAVAAARTPYVSPEMTWGAETLIQAAYDILIVLYFSAYFAVHGRTPGQALLRLRVVGETGAKPSTAQSMARALAMVFSMFLLFLPMAFAFFNPQRRALHDIVAGTYVVES
jgi:uncharacterized RDD family membrane protein YckC